uniref:Mos1 transposase HTH domain-containing protein n=1 Tax=Sipha flava TaxID=143950 RepID=A0A2S2QJL3_9HEMI
MYVCDRGYNFNMENNLEQRIAIKCCVKLKKSATETLKMMIKAYGELVMSHATVFKWHSQFSSGRESFDDEQRCGRPSTTKTDENIACALAVLNEHRNANCRLMKELTDILKTIVQRIIREDLRKRKLCTRFVPRALTTEQRQRRVSHAKDLLQMVANTPTF